MIRSRSGWLWATINRLKFCSRPFDNILETEIALAFRAECAIIISDNDRSKLMEKIERVCSQDHVDASFYRASHSINQQKNPLKEITI